MSGYNKNQSKMAEKIDSPEESLISENYEFVLYICKVIKHKHKHTHTHTHEQQKANRKWRQRTMNSLRIRF